jgi:hypothetical protein
MEKDRGHDNVVLVGRSTRNPCVKVCQDYGAKFHPDSFGRLGMRVAILLWAERLVLSRSPMMRAVMYLSPVRKTWYNFGGLGFRDVGCGPIWHSLQPFGAHWECIPPREYVLDMILDWHPSKVAKMLNGTCRWEYISDIQTRDWIDYPHLNIERELRNKKCDVPLRDLEEL